MFEARAAFAVEQADLAARAPVDAGRGQAECGALPGERAEELVRRSVGREALGAEQRGAGREHNEQVERHLARQFMQHQAALHLGAQRVGEVSRRELVQGLEADRRRGVDDAAHRFAVGPKPLEQAPHRGGVGHVRSFGDHFDAARAVGRSPQ